MQEPSKLIETLRPQRRAVGGPDLGDRVAQVCGAQVPVIGFDKEVTQRSAISKKRPRAGSVVWHGTRAFGAAAEARTAQTTQAPRPCSRLSRVSRSSAFRAALSSYRAERKKKRCLQQRPRPRHFLSRQEREPSAGSSPRAAPRSAHPSAVAPGAGAALAAGGCSLRRLDLLPARAHQLLSPRSSALQSSALV